MRRAPTPAEAELWKRVRDGRLGGLHFERQLVVEEFIVDFYCRTARLVVEVDGEIHESQTGRDAERDAFLTALGLRVLRFPNALVLKDIYAVLHEIRLAAEDSPRQR
jgi:very-short-patch-repair endonuclease